MPVAGVDLSSVVQRSTGPLNQSDVDELVFSSAWQLVQACAANPKSFVGVEFRSTFETYIHASSGCRLVVGGIEVNGASKIVGCRLVGLFVGMTMGVDMCTASPKLGHSRMNHMFCVTPQRGCKHTTSLGVFDKLDRNNVHTPVLLHLHGSLAEARARD